MYVVRLCVKIICATSAKALPATSPLPDLKQGLQLKHLMLIFTSTRFYVTALKPAG